MKIFITIDAYLPGYRFGGPVRSVANLVEWLGGDHAIFIFTKDRDLGADAAYAGVATDCWVSQGRAQVYYASPGKHTASTARGLIEAVRPDAVYLNGLWEAVSRGLAADRVEGTLYVLAPRGALGAGALGIKPLKKKLGLWLLQRRLRGIRWHATTAEEAVDIRRAFPDAGSVVEAPNLMARAIAERDPNDVTPPDERTARRFVAFSRISRKKNFDYLLRILGTVAAPLELDIIGPAEDGAYLEALRTLAEGLAGKTVRFLGERTPEALAAELPQYDFFVLPTKHENFGHVFVEAWAAGLPVVTSDQTPWRGLAAKGIGWDLALDDQASWRSVLEHCATMPAAEHLAMRRASLAHARELAANQPIERYEALFAW